MIDLTTPAYLPIEFEPATDRVTWLRLSEADYKEASFLDFRMVQPQSELRHSPWPDMPADARHEKRVRGSYELLTRCDQHIPDVRRK